MTLFCPGQWRSRDTGWAVVQLLATMSKGGCSLNDKMDDAALEG
jgi:hypothetical protein